MLIELERFAGIVIFATNFIENYDIAFARRLLHFVRFDLPDEDSRKKIFEVHLPKEFLRVFEDSVSIDALANLTDGFSGGDIRNVVLKTAAKAASQDLPDTEKTIKQEYFLNSTNEVKEAKDALMRKKVLINPDLKLN
jgi:SpoVK/Ycf46/Vps4 family AAA+-type ATPase